MKDIGGVDDGGLDFDADLEKGRRLQSEWNSAAQMTAEDNGANPTSTSSPMAKPIDSPPGFTPTPVDTSPTGFPVTDQVNGSSGGFVSDGPQTGTSTATGVNQPGAQAPVMMSENSKGYVDLTGDRRKHILEGDKKGGGHRYGTGIPGKSEFPADWSDEKILDAISDVATDPDANRGTGKWEAEWVEGTRDGVDIHVDLYPPNSKHKGKISTGYPTNTPKNPE